MFRKPASALATLAAAASIAAPADAQKIRLSEPCELYTTIMENSAQSNFAANKFEMRARIDSLVTVVPISDVVLQPQYGVVAFRSGRAPTLPLKGTTISFSEDSARVVRTKMPSPFTDELYLRMQRISSSRGWLGRVTGRADPEDLKEHGELWDSLLVRRQGASYEVPCLRGLGLHERFGDGENDYITVRFENGG